MYIASKLFIIITFTSIALAAVETEEQLVGGFQKQETKFCYPALIKVGQHSLSKVLEHTVVACHTQIVAGINYKLTLRSPTDSRKICFLVIYENLSQEFVLSHPNQENICVTE